VNFTGIVMGLLMKSRGRGGGDWEGGGGEAKGAGGGGRARQARGLVLLGGGKSRIRIYLIRTKNNAEGPEPPLLEGARPPACGGLFLENCCQSGALSAGVNIRRQTSGEIIT